MNAVRLFIESNFEWTLTFYPAFGSRNTKYVGGEDVLITDIYHILFMVVAIGIVHFFLQKFVFSPIGKAVIAITEEDQKKFEFKDRKQFLNSKSFALLSAKFNQSCFKLLMFTTLFLFGLVAVVMDNYLEALRNGAPKALSWEKGWFISGTNSNYRDFPKMRLRNIVIEPNQYVQSILDHSSSPIFSWLTDPFASSNLNITSTPDYFLATSPILFHYKLALALYIYVSILVLFNLEGPKQKDRMEMLVHHFITIFLIGYSFYYKLFRLGAVNIIKYPVTICDPWMELAKLNLYSGNSSMANGFFASFAAAFIYSRCYIFARYLVYGTIFYCVTEPGYFHAIRMPGWYSPLIGLVLLQCLHVFWSVLILKMIREAIFGKGVKKDIRDEE